MTILLWVLYPIAIQYERGGWWYLVAPITFIAWVVDVIANCTELSLLFLEFPREPTFSQRLSRLVRSTGWRSDLARRIAPVLNQIAPSGSHIK